MPAPRKYRDELRERAVRLVFEARDQDAGLSLNAAGHRIGQRVGVNPDTLRGWCRRVEIDAGRRRGATTADGAKIRELESEVRELSEVYLTLRDGSGWDSGRIRWSLAGCGW